MTWKEWFKVRERLIRQAIDKPTDWLHWTIVIVVFGITGTLSLLLTRFVLHNMFQVEGEIWAGPWSYRIAYLLFGPPAYTVTLVVVGSVFGKHTYFKERALRMWRRLLPRWTSFRSVGAVFRGHPSRRRSGIGRG